MLFYFENDVFYRKRTEDKDSSRPMLQWTLSGKWEVVNIFPNEGQDTLDKVYKMSRDITFKKWIILKKSENSWLQDGPFSSEEIFNKLKDGQLSEESHIWRKGFKKWTRLVDTKEFSGLFLDKNFESSYDLLDSVLEAPIYLEKKSHNKEEELDGALLKAISYKLKNVDFSEASVHIEAKSIRSRPQKGTYVFRDRAYSSKKRFFGSRTIYFIILAVILIVIYLIFA